MDTEGTINISFVDTALVVPQDSHGEFSQFSEYHDVYFYPLIYSRPAKLLQLSCESERSRTRVLMHVILCLRSNGLNGFEVSGDALCCAFEGSLIESLPRGNYDLTSLKDFQLVGHARAVANLSIGQLTFDPISFNVTSRLDGLRGLKGATVINSVDVVGGTSEAILLGINVSIHNPSNLKLNTGDLSMCFYLCERGID